MVYPSVTGLFGAAASLLLCSFLKCFFGLIIIILGETRLPYVRVRLALNRDSICAQTRAKYALGELKLDVKDMYAK